MPQIPTIVETLPVSEIFGPTLQGEGPAAGQPAIFIRLGGCNLSCSWCDTPYTWDGERFKLREELVPFTVSQIITSRQALTGPEKVIGPTRVATRRKYITVITGGEPLLHQNAYAWRDLVQSMSARGPVHLETNGTILPNEITRHFTDLISVSPKLAHAGLHRGKQDPTEAMGWPEIPQAICKVVVQTPDEVTEVVTRQTTKGWPRERIWVMPEGTTTEVLQSRWPDIAQRAANEGINATHRLHVLAWKDERGH